MREVGGRDLFGGQGDVAGGEVVKIKREEFLKDLGKIFNAKNINALKEKVSDIKSSFNRYVGGDFEISLGYVMRHLERIEKAKSLEEAKRNFKKLKDYLSDIETNGINDINLKRWKEYGEIITDSLWIFDRRDTSGAHMGWYWGNFVPQIPRQLMLRFTKRGDWVLDPFVGSGTTLIECRRLGRNCIGVELNPDVAEKARRLVEKEFNKFNVKTDIIVGDSAEIDFKKILRKRSIDKVQLIIMHPPYHDIIKFSDDPRDLSNAPSVEEFLTMFGKVLDNVSPVLEDGRYLAVVIGDKYSKGEWIPLGFYVMNEVMKRGKFILKSIVVKNYEETRAKRNQRNLWRYRALKGGFYVFKHEYILIFRKKEKKAK